MAKIEKVILADAKGRGVTTEVAGQPAIKSLVVDLKGRVQAKPDYIEVISDTQIVEGYNYLDTEVLCLIEITEGDTTLITRTWAEGDWADRADIFEL
jgi:hypothetical protein